MNPSNVAAQTQAWVEQLIVKYNICPFARKELENQTIHYAVINDGSMENILTQLEAEWQRLDEHQEIETTLFIIPDLTDFDAFLDVIGLAEQLLAMNGYQGVYQLAHFHPDYCFEGEAESDAANYTNRAPYATLHILREDSMAAALAETANPEQIPQRNIEFARRKGADFFNAILAKVRTTTNQ